MQCNVRQERYLVALLSLLIADVQVDVGLLSAILHQLLSLLQPFEGVSVPAPHAYLSSLMHGLTPKRHLNRALEK